MSILKKFNTALRNSAGVLTINQRNLHYIFPKNPRQHFPLADDKLLTKELLVPAGVPMPKTHLVYNNFYELAGLEDDINKLNNFVIKPAKGRVGGGIIALSKKPGENWFSISGKKYSIRALKKHISDIIFGVYSFDLHDKAIIEEKIVQHQKIEAISPFGLADIRLILLDDHHIMPMLRIPTSISDGKSNLHQGALGVGVDLETGVTNNAVWMGKDIDHHPDSGESILGIKLPFWQDVLNVAAKASTAAPLNYLGVDIAFAAAGPVLLEINVRPGLEIQNINNRGLKRQFTTIWTMENSDR